MNETPSGERVHIGFFGRRNAGKSSVLNALAGQDVAIVSPVPGTTTDPVRKSMELLPAGPVMLIDTPGVDDEGELGEMRVERAASETRRADVAVLVADAAVGMTDDDERLAALFEGSGVPYLLVFNKCDLADALTPPAGALRVSARTGENIGLLKERVAALASGAGQKLFLVGDLVHPADLVVLVTPIDKAAPKGRLILPQQQVIRDLLEADAAAVVVKEYELREILSGLKKPPAFVVTDSQVFAKAAADTPPGVPLTSFSILMARYKGFLSDAVRGVTVLDGLEDGDRLLICEGCTHHRQCDDIGRVKLPRWIRQHAEKALEFDFTSGQEFPDDLSRYRLVVHCGGCMLNAREIRYRQTRAASQGVPITNYGVLIAYMQGILPRSLSLFPHLLAELEGQAAQSAQ